MSLLDEEKRNSLRKAKIKNTKLRIIHA